MPIYSPQVPRTDIRSYDAAESFLRAGRNPDRRKVANNTHLRWTPDGFAVRLHETDVVVYHPNGSYTLRTGGWQSMTTRTRFDAFLPRSIAVRSVKGRWFVSTPNGSVPFYDGMRIGADGSLPPVPAEVAEQDKANAETRKAIAGYVKGLTDDKIGELLARARDGGTAGDCWYCSMGLAPNTTDHLASHVEEGYYMATLCANALAAKGYPSPVVILAHAPALVRPAVATYLRKALIVGAVAVR